MYQPYELTGLSQNGLVDLAAAKPVWVEPSNHNPVQVFLTKTQKARIAKAKSSGKGCKLQFSPAQLKYIHLQMKGEGIFADLIRAGWSLAKPYIVKAGRRLAEKALSRGVEWATEKGRDLVEKKLEKGISFVADEGKKFIEKKLSGGGVRKKMVIPRVPTPKMDCPHCHEQLGEGFWNKLARGIISGSTGFAASALMPGIPILPGALGGMYGDRMADMMGLGFETGETPMPGDASLKELYAALGVKKKSSVGRGLYL